MERAFDESCIETFVSDSQVSADRIRNLEALGRSTGGIVHDFNNLLAVIRANLDLAASAISEGRSSEALESIAKANRGVARGAALSGRLLSFARGPIEASDPCIPSAVLENVADMVASVIPSGVALRLDVAPDAWTAVADAELLEGALLNLVLNAKDAMPYGGEIRLGAANRSDSGSWVVFSVADDGVGMSKEIVSRASEAFFSTKGEGKGTGLGLSQVSEMVGTAGGKLEIDSVSGSGTTVRIVLPRGPWRLLRREAEHARSDPAAGSSKSILLVEDDGDLREAARGILSSVGYRVCDACDIDGAMRALRESGPFDVMIADIGLPDGSGYGLADSASDIDVHLRILFMTGLHDSEVREVSGRASLRKPFQARQLLDAVGLALAT